MSRGEKLIREAEARLSAALRAFEADADLDVAFGAPTAQERAEEAQERQEVAQLEAQARQAPGPGRRSNPLWSWNKRRK